MLRRRMRDRILHLLASSIANLYNYVDVDDYIETIISLTLKNYCGVEVITGYRRRAFVLKEIDRYT